MKIHLMPFLLLYTLVAFQAEGSEFRPLSLPPAPTSAAAYQKESSRSQPEVDESVYVRFKLEVRTMKAEERAGLVKSFSAKREQAIQNQQWEECNHYKRLIDILQGKE